MIATSPKMTAEIMRYARVVASDMIYDSVGDQVTKNRPNSVGFPVVVTTFDWEVPGLLLNAAGSFSPAVQVRMIVSQLADYRKRNDSD